MRKLVKCDCVVTPAPEYNGMYYTPSWYEINYMFLTVENLFWLQPYIAVSGKVGPFNKPKVNLTSWMTVVAPTVLSLSVICV